MARYGVCEVLMKGRPQQRGRGPRPPEMLGARGKPPKVTSHKVAKVNNSSGSKPQKAGAAVARQGWPSPSGMEPMFSHGGDETHAGAPGLQRLGRLGSGLWIARGPA